MDTTIKIPDLRFKFGNAVLVFEGVKEMEASKLLSELWDVSLHIESTMKRSKFARVNTEGELVSVLHKENI